MKILKPKLMTKLLMLSLLPMIILAVTFIVTSQTRISDLVDNQMESDLRALAVSVRKSYENLNNEPYGTNAEGVLAKGDIILGEYANIVDSLLDDGKMYSTLFIGNERIMTSLRNNNNQRNIGTTMDNESVLTQVLKNGGGYFNSNFLIGDDTYSVYYLPLYQVNSSEIIGMIFVAAPYSEVLDNMRSFIMSVLMIVLVLSLIATVIVVLCALGIVKELKGLVRISDAIAHGNLNAVISEKSLKAVDEIGDLAREIETMRSKLHGTVSTITESTRSISDNFNSISSSLETLDGTITDTSAATEELSASMQEMDSSSGKMAATAQDIERAVENVTEKASSGAVKSDEIYENATGLSKSVTDSIEKSNQMFNEIKESLKKGLEDSKAVDEINVLAEAILGITSQTTLLALNASIEAARAGEAGRGFAVVANEISALATNSKNTVSQIQEVTKVVMAAVGSLSESAKNLLNFVAEDVMKDYEDMSKAADSYKNDADYFSNMTADLSVTSKELLEATHMMMTAINEVSMSAQDGAKVTTQVAEQTMGIQMNTTSISDEMHKTNEVTNHLLKMVEEFKI